MGTTCERHVVDLVLHFYDAGFMQGILLNKFNKNLVPISRSDIKIMLCYLVIPILGINFRFFFR